MFASLLADVLADFFCHVSLYLSWKRRNFSCLIAVAVVAEILHLLPQPITFVLCCAVSSWFVHEISFSSCWFYCKNALGFHSVNKISPSIFSLFFFHATLSILVTHCHLLYLVITKDPTFSSGVRKPEFLPCPQSPCLSFSMMESIFTVFYVPHSLCLLETGVLGVSRVNSLVRLSADFTFKMTEHGSRWRSQNIHLISC